MENRGVDWKKSFGLRNPWMIGAIFVRIRVKIKIYAGPIFRVG